MESEYIEPQNTQKCAEIYNGSRWGDKEKVSVSFCVVCGLKKTTEDAKDKKKIRVLREIRWQQQKEIRC